MILQYRGFKNNWVFEDSEIIATTKLNLNDFINKPSERRIMIGIDGIKELHERIDGIIRNEIGDLDGRITYFVGDVNFSDLELVSIVMLKNKIYVLNSEAYLLNDSGKTISKIF